MSPPGDAGTVEVHHAHPGRRPNGEALAELLRRVIAAEGGTLHTLGVVLADHAHVLALNRQYLAHDYLTDVLSFDLSESAGVVEGELYIDVDTAAERHHEFGVTQETEVARYAVHGVLHLLGYDDATPEGRAAMRAREDDYLARFWSEVA